MKKTGIKGNTPPVFSSGFGRGQWDPRDWMLVKSPRWDHFGGWIQEEDHIRNETPPGATESEMLGEKAGLTYSSMLCRRLWQAPVQVECEMSFDDRMAPLVVIAEPCGVDAKGRSEYRRHMEVVLYDKGLNVWQHVYEKGKPSWTKIGQSDFGFAPKQRYVLRVGILKHELQITVDDHGLGCKHPGLPEAFQVGLTGCEGINRFYRFNVKAGD
ncbi:MAG: hypothetical protein PHV34_24970 [Verrucomicrobiae bacterium]|nr:hypothetical protein [Verrucomicrobiae bacterium]